MHQRIRRAEHKGGKGTTKYAASHLGIVTKTTKRAKLASCVVMTTKLTGGMNEILKA